MTDVIRLERRGDIALILVNNPPVNALGHAVRKGLLDVFEQADAAPEVTAVVLVCAGPTFMAGADIKEFGKPPQAPSLPEVIEVIEACNKPSVAVIHGTALGGGLEVALGCHYRIARKDAKVGLPEVKLGLLPGAGGTQRLPRAIGKAKAMDMALTGRMMDAAEAERSGLVSRVVPLDKLMDEALGAALVICEFSQIAVMAAKESVNRAFETGLSDGVMFERRMFHALFATADQKEGMDAFVNKRKAQFRNE
jgi:enoyl-CoA hydratase/carnithine racemase